VFSVVFGARWNQSVDESRLDFAIILFTGMIALGVFSECANRAPGLVLAQPNYVKKVVFPLEILPWTVVLSALFHAAIGLMVVVGLLLISQGQVHWTVTLAPVVLLPLALLSLGLLWFLSALGVYVRDTGQVIGVVVTALMFISPLFYPSSAIPQTFQWLVMINPLALPIEQLREVVVWGRLPNWWALGTYTTVSLSIMWAGFVWFQCVRNGFADVI
jgi:lipopolysaccharide transport system permease protein